ncbi:MAG: hypothetical protein FD189_1168 [Elusimicrobia bacterium]|nr:MAG: hypothetical protein FD154_1549 [Elusimicrobiota bacterium]KAF0156023.1 MAG: hypothetical protein FD189_1168 [Elusimicrobiota bacterium]
MTALKTIRTVLTAALLAPVLAVSVRAYGLTEAQAERMNAYEAAIASANPVEARRFLREGALLDKIRALDLERASVLISRAGAVRDLDDIFRQTWRAADANRLSETLEIRIDINKPLSEVGVGPEPEKLLTWLKNYHRAFTPELEGTVEKAIRRWEVVFGTTTTSMRMNWGQAEDRPARGTYNAVSVNREDWQTWTLRERNTVMARLSRDSAFEGFSDTAAVGRRDVQELQNAVDAARDSGALTPEQLSALDGKSLQEQAYLLGSFFDGGAAVPANLQARINSARASLPSEVLTSEQRALLGDMLKTSVLREVKGTVAGDRVVEFYSKKARLNISVTPCGGCDARYDASTGSIVMDSETVQQFLRLRGYSAESLMRDPAQLAELTRYLSPVIVRESSHQMQARWAAQQGLYLPNTQEAEIEASTLEATYTLEKLGRDAAFKTLFTDLRAASPYAQKRLDISTTFDENGSHKFASVMRQMYYAETPSLVAASSQVLSAVNTELTRRAGLSAAERAELDALGLPLADALQMQSDELAGSVRGIKTAALIEIRSDLGDLGLYTAHYRAETEWGQSVKKKSKEKAKGATVPMPGERS